MKFKAALWAMFAFLSVAVSSVATAGNYYVGGEFTDWKIAGTTATARTEGDTTGKQARFGWQMNENFAGELVYGINDDATQNESYYGVLLRPGTELFPRVKGSMILGMFRGDFFEGSEDFSWGFGFEVAPTRFVSITADWIHYTDEDSGSNGLRLTGYNIGLKFSFGIDDED